MTAAPFITVVINTHNYGHFIEEAIDSVLSQDFPHDLLEILVVDDGSTDDTPNRVKKYGSGIRYLYKPNGGQASALNLGIAEATGDIIALLDADDLFLPGKLVRVAEAFQKHPDLGMVYHPLLEWNMRTDERHDRGLSLVSGDVWAEPELFSSYIPHPTSCIAIRRSALGTLLPIPEAIRMMADCFIVQLIPLLAPVLAFSEPFVLYRIHGQNNCYDDESKMAVDARKKRLRETKILFKYIRAWLTDNGYSRRQLPVRFFRDRLWFHLWWEESLIKAPGRPRFLWFLIRENNARRHSQTLKVTIFNYLTIPLGLVSGYKKADVLQKWRFKTLDAAHDLFRRFFAEHSNVAQKSRMDHD